MVKTRALLIVAALSLAVLTTATPAAAYVMEALISISADQAVDEPTLEKAIRAAIDDVATHAVGFAPTHVSLREAKLVGNRIYLFVLFADAAGEAEIDIILKAGTARPGVDPH